MVSSGDFESELSYRDVKQANPAWSNAMIEDYFANKRDLVTSTENANGRLNTIELQILLLSAQIVALETQINAQIKIDAAEQMFAALASIGKSGWKSRFKSQEHFSFLSLHFVQKSYYQASNLWDNNIHLRQHLY